jgi:2'-5' RNA ligase
MIRCFISIDIPSSAKEELWKIIKSIKDDFKEKINFSKKENLHLTLAFLGDTEEKNIENIKKNLLRIKVKKFKVKLSDFGVFPSKKFIRILWAGLNSDNNEIYELRKDIISILQEIGINLDNKFDSHITLARIKFLHNKEKLLDFIQKIEIPEIEFAVSEIKFKKSTLGKNGPIYEDLFTIPFK